MWLSNAEFAQVISIAPLISIDIVVRDADGGILLGWRNNRPAQGCWFVPGGRIQKNESLDDAFARLTYAELGVTAPRSAAQWLGVFEHFYDDSVFGEGTSTHYIVLAYELVVERGELRLPTEQHSKYLWMTKDKIGESNLVHQYSKDYFS